MVDLREFMKAALNASPATLERALLVLQGRVCAVSVKSAERRRSKSNSPNYHQSAPPPQQRDRRFRELMVMARHGDEAALAELFQRYEFTFGRDEE